MLSWISKLSWVSKIAGFFTQFKGVTMWIVIGALALSLLANYALFQYTSGLKSNNAQLSQVIESQEQQNARLSERVKHLQDEKHQDQLNADHLLTQEREASLALQQRIHQLTKEIDHAPCHDVPIDYPANWVSGY